MFCSMSDHPSQKFVHIVLGEGPELALWLEEASPDVFERFGVRGREAQDLRDVRVALTNVIAKIDVILSARDDFPFPPYGVDVS